MCVLLGACCRRPIFTYICIIIKNVYLLIVDRWALMWSQWYLSWQILTINWRVGRWITVLLCVVASSLFITFATESIKTFNSHKFKLIFSSEILHEVFRWNLFKRQWEIKVFMNCLNQPLFNCCMLIFCPEFFHLISSSFWNVVVILNFNPKAISVEINGSIASHYVIKLDSFNNCKLLLFSNIQSFAFLWVIARHDQVILFWWHKLVATNHIWISFLQELCNPWAWINISIEKIFCL